MAHPFWGNNFFTFFQTLFTKCFRGGLYSDEVQLLVLMIMGISAALLGTFLFYRRMAMLANSLAHTVLLGIVATYLIMHLFGYPLDPTEIRLGPLLIASLITGLITTFSTDFLTRRLRVQEDASIGLVFTGFFALGILLITLFTRSGHIGIEAIMGNIDALHPDDITLSLSVLALNVGLLALYRRPLTISTFDPTFAKTVGIPVTLMNYLLMVQTSATAIGSFRAIGVFLFLAFLVGPPLVARKFSKRLLPQMGIACAVVILVSLLSVALSRHALSVYAMPLSTSGLSVVLLGMLATPWRLKKTKHTESYGH